MEIRNENRKFLNIFFSNQYLFKKHNIELTAIQKIVAIQFMNRGPMFSTVILVPTHFIALSIYQLVTRKPKRWARKAFFDYFMYTFGMYVASWGVSRFLFPNEIISFVFKKQIDYLKEKQMLDDPNISDKILVENRLVVVKQIQLHKTTKGKKLDKQKNINIDEDVGLIKRDRQIRKSQVETPSDYELMQKIDQFL